MTVYEKIDNALRPHEEHRYAPRSLDSIADYINWAWKFRKITAEQRDEVCDRICILFEEEIAIMKARRK